MLFNQIYKEYSTLVYNLCLQYVQNVEDAEEITQDVFVKIHDSWSSFQYESALKTWIYRITINKSLDFLKAKRRKKRFAIIANLFTEKNEIRFETPHFNHPGVTIENKEKLKLIFEKINQLPDNQRTALILSKIEHKSQSEIADIMQLSTKAVESLVQRSKVNLQKLLN